MIAPFALRIELNSSAAARQRFLVMLRTLVIEDAGRIALNVRQRIYSMIFPAFCEI